VTRNRTLFAIALIGCAVLLPAQALPEYAEYQIRTITTVGPKAPTTFVTVYFGRNDGSKGARTTEVIAGKSCTTTTYWDMKSRTEVTASDCVAMKNTVPFVRLPGAAWPPAKQLASCATIVDGGLIGSEFIQGLRVDQFETNDATVKSIEYVAPDLGCLKIRALHYWKSPNGQITGTTIEQPAEVRLGAPDQDLFKIPGSFREVLPSERRNALHRFFTGREAPPTSSGDRFDKRYLEARTRQPN
jgi:hypothetical protein